MLPLGNSELTMMRDVLEVSLPGTAVIHGVTETGDGQGGVTQTYGASGTVDARVSPLSQAEAVRAERLGIIAAYTITVPQGTALTAKDRVVFQGATYEVTSVSDRPTWELGRRAYLASVT